MLLKTDDLKTHFFLGMALLALTLVMRTALSCPFSFLPFLGAFTLMGWTAIYAAIRPLPTLNSSRLLFWGIPLSAFLLRMLLVTPTPLLSNDAYRYIWDGALIWNGLNPLSLSPLEAVAQLPHLNIPLPPNHQNIPSLYPLISQVYFALGFLLHPSPLIFGIFASLLDAFTTFLLLSLLQERKQPLNWVFLFAWHPLSIIESGHGGHVEALGLFFLVLCLRFATRPILSGLSLAGAALVKLWPVILCPILWSGKRLPRILAFGILFSLGFLALWNRSQHFSGLLTYLETWEFHGAVFSLAREIFSNEVSRWLCLSAFLIATFWILWRQMDLTSPSQKAISILVVFLYCAPTIHPWYVLWLIPLLVLHPSLPWIYLTFAMVSAYAVLPAFLESQVWIEPSWPKWVTYLPPLILWGIRKRPFDRRVKKVT